MFPGINEAETTAAVTNNEYWKKKHIDCHNWKNKSISLLSAL